MRTLLVEFIGVGLGSFFWRGDPEKRIRRRPCGIVSLLCAHSSEPIKLPYAILAHGAPRLDGPVIVIHRPPSLNRSAIRTPYLEANSSRPRFVVMTNVRMSE